MSPNVTLSPFPQVDSTTTTPTRFEVRVPIDLLHHFDPKLALHLLPVPEDPLDTRIAGRDYAWPVAEKLARTINVMLFGTEPEPFRSLGVGYVEEEKEDGDVAERPCVSFRLDRNVTGPSLDPQVFTLTAEEAGDDGENKLVFRTVQVAEGEERDTINCTADTAAYGKAPKPVAATLKDGLLGSLRTK